VCRTHTVEVFVRAAGPHLAPRLTCLFWRYCCSKADLSIPLYCCVQVVPSIILSVMSAGAGIFQLILTGTCRPCWSLQ